MNHLRFHLIILLVIVLCATHSTAATDTTKMVRIEGGEFLMGATDTTDWPGELPQHRVRISSFYMDVTEVTNQQFADFVKATGYITIAEQPVDWEQIKKQVPVGTPKPPDSVLQPGSLVFVQPRQMVDLNNASHWWKWVVGASWRHPEGPGSSIDNRMDHPVVHVTYDDAVAYAAWVGKSLPTEAEWEYASRGGVQGARYHWGNNDASDTTPPCNIWQGQFPIQNTLADGALRTNRVGSYAPNAFGLYDMAGNVWEWCSDKYRADAYEYPNSRIAEQSNKREERVIPSDSEERTFNREERVIPSDSEERIVVDPTGPSDSWDPNDAVPTTLKHVIRGGSFLCHRGYCESYRNSARRGETPDTGMSHIGFRCVRR